MNATIIAIAALILSVINLAIGVVLVVKVTNLADYEEIHVETNRKLLEIDSDFSKHQIEFIEKLINENREFKTSVLDCIEKDHDTTMDLHKNLLNLISMDHDIHYGLTKSLNGLIEDSTKVNDERWNLICDYITNDKADSEIPECCHCWRDEESGVIIRECEEL